MNHPAIDIVTEKTAVAVQDRPVVPLASWLTDAVSACGRSGRGFQVLSSAESRLTFALRTVLNSVKARWVVEEPDGGGHYDGFSGIPLVWSGNAAFVPAPGEQDRSGPSRTFVRDASDLGSQLLVDLRVLHPAGEDLVLGGAAETLAQTLGEADPAGWGTSEPALSMWDRAALTALCRRRTPQATWFTFAGPGGWARSFVGTQRVSRVTSGVKETISFAVGYAKEEEIPLDRLAALAEEFTRQGILQTMTVQRTTGRPDLTYEPYWSGVPIPVGMAVGAEGVAEIGLDRALAAPTRGRTVGPRRAPSVWYRIGDGTDPDAWTGFRELMTHLRPEGPETV
ncbi:DUF6177 family protein [Actinorugispora endophytica]|uniref:Uncharacterized protein n=1 Tax=Actinorugispora endophytica TaxID=1605990 RepID=A0A4V3D8L5_9ACTN|nr:DUF6177 family protein [Actinorugispora endophytica]TDQ52276.1 hypothetical protein EV190_107108 [Actinorugispora endophytica]